MLKYVLITHENRPSTSGFDPFHNQSLEKIAAYLCLNVTINTHYTGYDE